MNPQLGRDPRVLGAVKHQHSLRRRISVMVKRTEKEAQIVCGRRGVLSPLLTREQEDQRNEEVRMGRKRERQQCWGSYRERQELP
jgi:hypothetical protein